MGLERAVERTFLRLASPPPRHEPKGARRQRVALANRSGPHARGATPSPALDHKRQGPSISPGCVGNSKMREAQSSLVGTQPPAALFSRCPAPRLKRPTRVKFLTAPHQRSPGLSGSTTTPRTHVDADAVMRSCIVVCAQSLPRPSLWWDEPTASRPFRWPAPPPPSPSPSPRPSRLNARSQLL